MIKLFIRSNRKAWTFFIMKGATGLIISAGLLQGHTAIDHLDNVGAIDQIMNKMLWNKPGHAILSL
jgi:hypothetical protein